VLGLQRANIPG